MNSLPKHELALLLESKKVSEEFMTSMQNTYPEKLIIGSGGCGKVRLAIAIFGNEKVESGEIVCVKKTSHFGFKNHENHKLDYIGIFNFTISDFIQTQLPDTINAPKVLDMAFVFNKSLPKKKKKRVYLHGAFPS